MSKWFAANKVDLNLDKTNITKFIATNSPQFQLDIGYNDKYSAVLTFVYQIMALCFMVISVPPAVRQIRILLLKQHV
jgi:hypothetical protein